MYLKESIYCIKKGNKGRRPKHSEKIITSPSSKKIIADRKLHLPDHSLGQPNQFH